MLNKQNTGIIITNPNQYCGFILNLHDFLTPWVGFFHLHKNADPIQNKRNFYLKFLVSFLNDFLELRKKMYKGSILFQVTKSNISGSVLNKKALYSRFSSERRARSTIKKSWNIYLDLDTIV